MPPAQEIFTTMMRMNEVTIEGIALPIAWNMLAVTKVIPEATKLSDTIRK